MFYSYPEFNYLKAGRVLVYVVFYVMLRIKVRSLNMLHTHPLSPCSVLFHHVLLCLFFFSW